MLESLHSSLTITQTMYPVQQAHLREAVENYRFELQWLVKGITAISAQLVCKNCKAIQEQE